MAITRSHGYGRKRPHSYSVLAYRPLMSCLAIIRITANRDAEAPGRLGLMVVADLERGEDGMRTALPYDVRPRDRVVVTWTNADQTQSTDHLDIRYCKQ